MKRLLLLLFLFSLSFAVDETPEWIPIALLAVIAGLGVLIIFYLISYVVEADQMRAMAISEMWQVVITGVMIAGLIGAQALATEFGSGMAKDFGAEDGDTHMDFAIKVTQETVAYQWATLMDFTNNIVIPMGDLASLSGNCWLFGVAFTYSGCSSINVPFSSASLAARTMAMAILALNSQLVLLNLASRFFFPVLLPLGLFLRTFHVTRGTGGVLIAFAVAFYFVYPLATIITKGMSDEVPLSALGIHYPEPPAINQVGADETWEFSNVYTFEVPAECDPFKTYDYGDGGQVEGFGYTQTQINYLLNENMLDPLLFIFMISGIFNPALSILMALAVLRPLTRVFGTEVDVSALGKVS
ncbi:hypothetical protein H0O01_02905 [Candidatus Micrarchaeota archaeon]|nr:hypothetical protein [Candidatus Micrarchaeota archaeon]